MAKRRTYQLSQVRLKTRKTKFVDLGNYVPATTLEKDSKEVLIERSELTITLNIGYEAPRFTQNDWPEYLDTASKNENIPKMRLMMKRNIQLTILTSNST